MEITGGDVVLHAIMARDDVCNDGRARAPEALVTI